MLPFRARRPDAGPCEGERIGRHPRYVAHSGRAPALRARTAGRAPMPRTGERYTEAQIISIPKDTGAGGAKVGGGEPAPEGDRGRSEARYARSSLESVRVVGCGSRLWLFGAACVSRRFGAFAGALCDGRRFGTSAAAAYGGWRFPTPAGAARDGRRFGTSAGSTRFSTTLFVARGYSVRSACVSGGRYRSMGPASARWWWRSSNPGSRRSIPSGSASTGRGSRAAGRRRGRTPVRRAEPDRRRPRRT
jgi:hypothetical protein